MTNRKGKGESSDRFFLGSKSLWTVTAAMKLRHLLLGRKAMTDPDRVLKSRDITLLREVCVVKVVVFQ